MLILMRVSLALFALLVLCPLAEGETLLVTGALVDTSIAAPLIDLRFDPVGRDEYRFSVSGWTLEGMWRRELSPSRTLLVSADATPLNAHSSDRIYVAGTRMRNLEYDNASYRVKGGMRFIHSARSATEVQVVGLSEQLGSGVDPALARIWDRPYAGIEFTHTWSDKTAKNPLIAAWDGMELSVRGETYAGQQAWSRVTVAEAASRTLGRFDLQQSLTVMNGKSLNMINRFLVGGSWDVLGPNALYGFRHAEFRADRAVIANGGIDYLLPRNWRVGVRGSHLRSNVANVSGHAINASTTWRTFGVNFGVGIPHRSAGENDPVVYMALVAPLYKR